MFAARLSSIPITTFVSSFSRPAAFSQPIRLQTQILKTQNYATRVRPFRKIKQQLTLGERARAPAGDTAFSLGRGLVAGSSLVGIGAICYYGLGMSNQIGAIDRVAIWPEIVRERVRNTYMYFGGGIIFTAASAMAVARTPALMRMMTNGSWMALGLSMVAMIGSGMVCRSIPYKEGLGAKQLAWMVHAGIIGAVVAPLAFLGGPILIRAAWYTAGVVGGLSTLAMCAPSEKFLNMGAPLTMGLAVVFASSIGGMFFPPTTALGAGLYSISIYGGLVLFSMFLLYDTQKVIKRAETHPVYAMQPFDPVNNSIGIYMDTVNIFIRLAMILANGGGRRK